MHSDISSSAWNLAACLRIHGPGLCYICKHPKAQTGSDLCSYPHARLPEHTDPALPAGMATWRLPKG